MSSVPVVLCLQLVRFTCPGHADPQPLDCPGFQFAVPPTVRLPKRDSPAPEESSSGGWLAWARQWAQRMGLSFFA